MARISPLSMAQTGPGHVDDRLADKRSWSCGVTDCGATGDTGLRGLEAHHERTHRTSPPTPTNEGAAP